MKTLFLNVEGMSCGHCRSAVERALRSLPGAEAVTVELEAGRAEVTTTDDLSANEVVAAIEEAGYSAQVRSEVP